MPSFTYTLRLFLALLLVLCSISHSLATPVEVAERDAAPESDNGNWYYEYKRTYFPDSPPSCQLCERDYENINSCANASVVFANISAILWNPLYFIDVIQCACADTFQSAYPQCVDCFTQTNQTGFLVPENGANMSTIVTNIRSICALGSSIFGHVASANSQLPGQTPITVPPVGAAPRTMNNILAGLGKTGIVGMSVLLSVGMGVWTVL